MKYVQKRLLVAMPEERDTQDTKVGSTLEHDHYRRPGTAYVISYTIL